MKTISAILAATALALLSPDAGARSAAVSDAMVNLSESALATEPGYSDYAPEIALSGSTVHALWATQTPTAWQLHYRRSADGGLNWEARKLLLTDTGILNEPTHRKLAVDGSTVHVFQGRTRSGPGGSYGVLTYLRSGNGGLTFAAETDIATTAVSRSLTRVYGSASGSRVTVGYTDIGDDQVIKVATSEDGGNTFTERVAHQVPAAGGQANLWDVKALGNNIYALFSHLHAYNGSGGELLAADLYLAASTNRGATFGTTLLSVPSNVRDTSGNPVHKTVNLHDGHYAPHVAASGQSVFAAWCGVDASGAQSLFYRWSSTAGATFGNAVNVTKGVLPAGRVPRWGHEAVAVAGSHAYLAFVAVDKTDDWLGSANPSVNVIASSNAGGSFSAIREIAPAGVPDIAGAWPLVRTDPIDATGASVHVLWNPPAHAQSSDGGETFSGPALLSAQFTGGVGNRPQFDVSAGGTVHYVFERSVVAGGFGGDIDIFYRRLAPPPAPSLPGALSLSRSDAGGRFDNMQVRAGPDINFTTAMTAEAWVKPDRIGGRSGYFLLKADPASGSFPGSWALGQAYTGAPDARIRTTGGDFALGGAAPVANGEWTHLAMTYDAAAGAGNFRLYVNGSLVATATATGEIRSGLGPLFIGHKGAYGYENGLSMDEVRLWDRALSQAEILANRVTSVPGNSPGLTACFRFDGTTRDATGRGNDGILMYRESFTADVVFPPLTAAPAFTSAAGTTFALGVANTFTVTATGTPPPSLSMTGALPAGVTFDAATGVLAGTPGAGAAGNYGITFRAANGILPDATQGFTLTVDGSPANAPRLGNLSTRGPVLTGDDVMIGGFIIGGSAPKKVLITARGPSLASYGVPGVLANPSVQLFAGQGVIAANDDWETNGNAGEILALGVFPNGLAPSDARESALLVTLSPGAYTAIVSGSGGGTGVGIVEVFEIDQPGMPLINISTRGPVRTGDEVMIGGFIIFGSAPQKVLVTARGPSLAPYGIANPLANPVLQLFAGQALIASNDNWGTSPNLAEIYATGVAPTDQLEAAILITLPPGAYTAIVSGADGGTGVGIVEVFAR